MKIAKPLQKVIESFEKLPGVGPKSAQRLAYYLLHVPQTELEFFAESLSNLKKNTVLCNICKNVSEVDPCEICSDDKKNKSVCLVVEQPLDILAFEKTGKFNGVYHVLHGAISPLDNIGPDEIFIERLLERMDLNPPITEVIIATNPTMEGDATAMYISKQIKAKNDNIIVTRLGMGVPTGADLGYADENTLNQALAGRRELI
ncbi:recombination mediator RecR [Candidatus Microgenomates bacterium]|nr:recombination mediator RecR [Candidatus Microgenomates bacterium]